MNIIAKGLRGRGANVNKAANLRECNDNPVPPDQALATLLDFKRQAARDLAAICAPGGRIAVAQEIIQIGNDPKDTQRHRLSLLIERLTGQALGYQQQQLGALTNTFVIPNTDRYLSDAESIMGQGDPLAAAVAIRELQNKANTGVYQRANVGGNNPPPRPQRPAPRNPPQGGQNVVQDQQDDQISDERSEDESSDDKRRG